MMNLQYARNELNKYWNLVTHENHCNIRLVVDEDLAKKFYPIDYSKKFDDAFDIKVNQGIGSITGINKRSVLLGVYRFFSELGCQFLSPNGEVIVNMTSRNCNLELEFAPSNRHRGICIEGSVSLENCKDLIEWAPKVGFNSYFIQFRYGNEFFERWYTHQRNNQLESEGFSNEDAVTYTNNLIAEIEKRDMVFHAVGHGWTCECLGIKSVGWSKVDNDSISPDIKPYLALIKGKREFFEGIPLNTHLCYSNPKVKEMMVNEIVNYLKENKTVDVLHFWLADNFNNFCECDKCRTKNPSDHYVDMLNLLDKRLTTSSIDTKIVFLIYYELLWTPSRSKIENEDRFIMMFAPISRTYTQPYLNDGVLPDKDKLTVKKFNLNEVKNSDKVEDNLAYLFKWQEHFKGDSFLFDYHLMWDGFKDYPNLRLSKTIFNDINALKKLRLNGLMSCQLQRSFFPTAFPMYVMGKTLFDSSINYDKIEREFFNQSFGDHGNLVLEMLYKATKLFSFEYARAEVPMISLDYSKRFAEAELVMINFKKQFIKIYDLIDDKESLIGRNIKTICFFTEFTSRLAPILSQKASGAEGDLLINLFEPLNDYMLKHENEFQSIFDGFYFNLIVGDLIKAKW